MSTNIYTGNVLGVCKIATGTPSGFCSAVTGGTFTRKTNSINKKGISGVQHTRRGVDEITLSIDCIGVDKADLQLFFPTTLGSTVASFPDFLVQVDDGASGQEWVLSGGQPSNIKISIGNGPDAELEVSCEMKFTTATEATIGTDVPVYLTYKNHAIVDAASTVGGDAYGVSSFEISNDLGLELVKTMDSASFAATAYAITQQDLGVSFTTTNALNSAAMDADFTPADLVFTLTNGTAGENITITCNDFEPENWEMPIEAEGVIYFKHDYIPSSGTQYNRIVFS